MRMIESWKPGEWIQVSESKGGVLAAVNALENLISAGIVPWPTPELIQKLYASSKFQGRSDDDEAAAKSVLGHYCDLQSINSEDAVTWSVFGPLLYGAQLDREIFTQRLFRMMEIPKPKRASLWLWRRIPHPEKLESQGGLEIDFGVLTDRTLVLGEAKWNSALGAKQGVGKNRTQQELRIAYCQELGRNALPGIDNFCVLGVGRRPDVLDTSHRGDVLVKNLTWSDLVECLPAKLVPEVSAYLIWKSKYSSSRRY